MLIVPFRSDSSAGGANVANAVADMVRERTSRRIGRRELEVLGAYHLNNLLRQSDYNRRAVLNETELRLVASRLRADETIYGSLTRVRDTLVLTARLARLRNWRLQQPLPAVRAATPALLGEQLAIEIVKARAQLTGLRRCENALATGQRSTAVREAERAIRAYPQAVIARDCLITALFDGRTAADSLLVVCDDVLALDSGNTVANVVRAQSLEALRRRDAAARQWSRVYALHRDSLPLGVAAVDALLRLAQPQEALEDARALHARFGANAALRRLTFRAHAQLGEWKQAAILGDSLELEDEVFRSDSAYATRYVEALRQIGDTLAALELGVRNVRRFPGDARLYLQYLQILSGEQLVALPRALTRFPDAPAFPLLAATMARRAGNRPEAMRATREALRRDSTLAQPYLALAEYFLEEQRPDSAVRVLERAPRTGDGAESLRSYAIARGLGVLRTAGDSLAEQQQAAMELLLLADTIASRTDSRAYVAAAALQRARNQLVTASRTRRCADLDQADGTLALSASAIARGLGDGANTSEIVEAFAAMRAAVDRARPLLCPP